MSAGKGDKPRNCFSKQFKENYDNIDWKKSYKNSNKHLRLKNNEQQIS